MLWVRTDPDAAPRACAEADLREGGSVRADRATTIARAEDGPFVPLAVALQRDDSLREGFAAAIPTPSLTAWSRSRLWVLAACAPPMLVLLELDRELASASPPLLGIGRLVADLFVVAFVVVELARRTPRLPAVAGAAMVAIAMRWALVAARLCGKNVHVAVWAAAALSVGAGLAILARAPSRSRVALELLAKVGLRREDVLAVQRAEVRPPTNARFVAAIASAAGLPVLLVAMRRAGLPLAVQAAGFVLYGLVVPVIVQRFTRADGAEGGPAAARAAAVRPASLLLAILAGLAATGALVHGTHQFFEIGGELARCTARLDDESKKMLAAEAAEIARRIASVRGSFALALMTTAVMPLAEERIYRGVLMETLAKKYGTTYGMFAAAVAFGVAHVGVYEIGLYQTVLLGIGFGVAYAEGGIVAAFVVHAAWNLLNVT